MHDGGQCKSSSLLERVDDHIKYTSVPACSAMGTLACSEESVYHVMVSGFELRLERLLGKVSLK